MKIFAKYKDSIKTVSVTSIIVLTVLLMRYLVLPLINVNLLFTRYGNELIKNENHNSIQTTYTKNGYTALDVLFYSSVDTPDGIKKDIDKDGMSVLKFHTDYCYDLADVSRYVDVEYAKELNNVFFYVMLKNKNSAGEDVYYCIFFQYLLGFKDKLYKYTGITLCIQPTLCDRAYLTEHGFENYDVVLSERRTPEWYEKTFGVEYPYKTRQMLSENNVGLNSSEPIPYEYYLLRDGIAKIYTSRDRHGDYISSASLLDDKYLLPAEEELKELFSYFRSRQQ